MFRGFYTAASGMIAQQRRTEILTNNMSNVNTPGYKADQTSMRAFPEMLLRRIDETSIPVENKLNLPFEPFVGSLNTGVYLQETMPNFRQGDLRETGLSTDLALQGESVFFTVQNEAGETRYTRNGNFTIDLEGYLTTASGLYVQDTEGERIQLTSDQFTVDSQGRVTENGAEVAQIGVAYAEDPNALIKEGDGLYRIEGAALPQAFGAEGAAFAIHQSFLEGSTTDAARTMTDMLTAYRAFEANQKVLTAYDRSMEKAANEIGRVT
ncbi:flagellar hook-basal body protein [Domibacillus epiphyticus]|uniref:Flagellar biosynthesis protein FlgC n=1 Tax=Domibacillus epiphyticus TaxID=1714355 RepID=A0A1V2A6V7_9BACI|nr:flagellar hook-basal body protein [Domibacillus epiphyticus]OMP66602.1 flagellar biosynthesis protein FlgC [Domibacillus epiphyticus]